MRRSAVVGAVLCLVLVGCSDSQVTSDEVGELEGVRDVRVQVASETFRVQGLDARTGVATGRGERVPFAVVIGEPLPREASIGSRSYQLSSGCAGAGFYTETDEFNAVASMVETAVYDELASDAYCEG